MHSAGEHTARPQTWEARRSAWSGQASRGLRERSRRAPTSGTCSRLAHVANRLSYSAGLRDKSGQAAGMLLRNEITDSPSNKFKRRHLGPFTQGLTALRGSGASRRRPRVGDHTLSGFWPSPIWMTPGSRLHLAEPWGAHVHSGDDNRTNCIGLF